MKEVNQQELVAVVSLPGRERYDYFVRTVADCEEVWTLRAPEGFVLMGVDEQQELVPVWPHRRFAEVCAEVQWKGAEPAGIPLDRWLEGWTPGMRKDQRAVAVFPVPMGQGVVVTPDRLYDDLLAERSQYE